MSQLEQWIAEITAQAYAKKNSALPLNRRVQTRFFVSPTHTVPLTKYVRGTCVVLGQVVVKIPRT